LAIDEMVTREAFIHNVAETTNQFFQTVFTVQPKDIRVIVAKEMIIIKLAGIFSPGEKQLAMSREGDELINKVYKRLFDIAAPVLKKMLQPAVNGGIQSLNIEIHTKNMECFCLVSCSKNIEEEIA
jgi:uncharacterized protein YbcI